MRMRDEVLRMRMSDERWGGAGARAASGGVMAMAVSASVRESVCESASIPSTRV